MDAANSNQEASLLLDLPGLAFHVLWSCLDPATRLSLFGTCAGLRDRILSSCGEAKFKVLPHCISSAEAQRNLRALLERECALQKMSVTCSLDDRLWAGHALALLLQAWAPCAWSAVRRLELSVGSQSARLRGSLVRAALRLEA